MSNQYRCFSQESKDQVLDMDMDEENYECMKDVSAFVEGKVDSRRFHLYEDIGEGYLPSLLANMPCSSNEIDLGDLL